MNQKLCAIGEVLIDFIPDAKGQRLKDVSTFKRVVGGAPANVAGAVSKLGGQAKLITQVGKDAFGDHIIESLAHCGIDTSDVLHSDKGDTSLAFVSLTDDGNRDFMFYRRTCADKLLEVQDIKDDALKDCGILHFCSVSLVEAPIKYAHKKLIDMAIQEDILISFDPNLRLSLWKSEEALRKTVLEFIPYADILKIADEELVCITGCNTIEEALPKLMQGRVKMVIYTKGKEGASLYVHDICVHVKGLSIDVRDTTGAGDSFIGAFLYKLLENQKDKIFEISEDEFASYLEFANYYAAYTTSKEGALDAMATMDELQAYRQSIEIRNKEI